MTLLAVLLTHLGPEPTAISLANLRGGLPDASRIVLAHGGRRDDYEAISFEAKLFTQDEGLRGAPATAQSYNEILDEVLERFVAPDPEIEHVLLVEFDQVVLGRRFGAAMIELLESTGADFLGKNCIDRTATNWWHRVRYRDDEALLRFLRGVSVRDDPTRLWGCLGSGFMFRRRVLEAFCALEHLPGIYNELYIPTVVHHLGFRVVDVDAVSDLYDSVRWTPPYAEAEVRALRAAGACIVHPFKAIDAVPRFTAEL